MASVIPFPAPGRPAVPSERPAPSPKRLMRQRTPDQPAWAVHLPWRSLPCDFAWCFGLLGLLPIEVRRSLSGLDLDVAAYLFFLGLVQLHQLPEQQLPWCSPRIEVLAVRCGAGEKTIRRSLARLRAAGILKTKRSLRPKAQGSGKWQGVLMYAPGDALLQICRSGLTVKSDRAKNSSLFSFFEREKKRGERQDNRHNHHQPPPCALGALQSASDVGGKQNEDRDLTNHSGMNGRSDFSGFTEGISEETAKVEPKQQQSQGDREEGWKSEQSAGSADETLGRPMIGSTNAKFSVGTVRRGLSSKDSYTMDPCEDVRLQSTPSCGARPTTAATPSTGAGGMQLSLAETLTTTLDGQRREKARRVAEEKERDRREQAARHAKVKADLAAALARGL